MGAENTVMQDLCEMLSYLILPKVEFGTGHLLSLTVHFVSKNHFDVEAVSICLFVCLFAEE